MVDKVQRIRKEVERLQNELIQEKRNGFGSDVDDACILELQNVLTYIDSLQEESIGDIEAYQSRWGKSNGYLEEPVSEDLEEAAHKYADGENPTCPCEECLIKTFKAGAEWQKAQEYTCYEEAFEDGAKWKKQQMIAKTIDARCFGFQGAALFSFRLPPDNYLVGSEVKVIVIKEN